MLFSRCRCIFAVVLYIVTAYQETPAQQPRVYRDRVTPHWSADNNQFWYRNDLSDNRREFVLVDVNAARKTAAFDHNKIAQELSRITGREVDSERLPIRSLEFPKTPGENRQLILQGDNVSWTWNAEKETLQKNTEKTTATGSNFFLPATRSQGRGEEIYLQISNNTQRTLRLAWIDAGGERTNYGTILPGKQKTQHTFAGHAWVLISDSGADVAAFIASPKQQTLIVSDKALTNVRQRTIRRERSQRNRSAENQASPNSKWLPFVREHNLWIENQETNKQSQLTSDATPDFTFTRDASRERMVSLRYSRPDYPSNIAEVRWSPDSRFLLAFQTQKAEEKFVHIVQSSPDDSLQPKLISYPYAKPGDDIPIGWPRLFSVKDGKEIPLAHETMPHPWEIRFLRWSEDGKRFWLLYNARGHQTLQVIEVNTSDGQQKVIVNELSNTFIHYSTGGKFVLEWLTSSNSDTPTHLLWASERTGWNHLYRYDVESGDGLNPVTAGKWNVRRIEHIDQQNEQIWFYAVGIHQNQDPYHEHFCRVNFDGSGLAVLTDGDGTHEIEWSPDRRFFFDRFSRVDLPPITELRKAEDGTLVCLLETANAAEVLQQRGSFPIRFTAQGRDGKTDIWGIIHRPKGFDPNRKYPVIENIYAGPHDHHVPKAFRATYRHQQQIADQGFFVVQIDGMGTAWRSKVFHDVCYKNLKDAGFPDRIAWMKAAAEQYPEMDLNNVGIYGGSAGGQNAMAALLWHGPFYKAAVADCGCHDNRMDKIWWNEQWMGWPVDEAYTTNSNTENAHRLNGKLMLVVGELDKNVDPATTTQVVKKLIEANKSHEFLLIPDRGHGACETPWASEKRINFFLRHLSNQVVSRKSQ